MELIKHLYHLNLPITVITNCSLLHEVDLDELKKYIQFITCSIDSVFEDSYCKVQGVRPEIFQRVMNNLDLLNQHNVPHYFNSVITKFNIEEFDVGVIPEIDLCGGNFVAEVLLYVVFVNIAAEVNIVGAIGGDSLDHFFA